MYSTDQRQGLNKSNAFWVWARTLLYMYSTRPGRYRDNIIMIRVVLKKNTTHDPLDIRVLRAQCSEIDRIPNRNLCLNTAPN